MPVSYPVNKVENDEDGEWDPHGPGIYIVNQRLLASCKPNLNMLKQKEGWNDVFITANSLFWKNSKFSSNLQMKLTLLEKMKTLFQNKLHLVSILIFP